jgi:HEAT repeat protein
MVREVAQAASRRTGVDPAERYRVLVRATTPADPGAVAGLGETGTDEDVELVRPSLADARPRGRVEAVRALRRLGSVDLPTLVVMLDDPATAVTRQVTTTLLPRAGDISGDRLGELLNSRQSPHVRTAAYRLLRAQGLWTRLLTDLELFEDDDETLQHRARGDLSAWLERDAATTYSMPSAAIAARLDTRLRRVAPSLGPNRERLLRFHLGLNNRFGQEIRDTQTQHPTPE